MQARTLVSALVTCAAILIGAASGTAAPAAFQASGAGQLSGDPTAPGGAPFTAEGTGTHLGAWTNAGTLRVMPTSSTSATASGSVTFVAASGDALTATIEGTLDLTTGAGAATFTWTGGTGRFAHASGSASFAVQNAPDGSFTFEADGYLQL